MKEIANVLNTAPAAELQTEMLSFDDSLASTSPGDLESSRKSVDVLSGRPWSDANTANVGAIGLRRLQYAGI